MRRAHVAQRAASEVHERAHRHHAPYRPTVGVYGENGKLVEKYDVIATGRPGGGGEYPLQDGFGWTNGVMRKLMALYPEEAALTESERCLAPAV